MLFQLSKYEMGSWKVLMVQQRFTSWPSTGAPKYFSTNDWALNKSCTNYIFSAGIIFLFLWRHHDLVFARDCNPPFAPKASTIRDRNHLPDRALDRKKDTYYSSLTSESVALFQVSIDGNCSVAGVRIRNILSENCTLQVWLPQEANQNFKLFLM